MTLHLPTVNAGLNSLCALFLLLGLISIKKKNRSAHRLFMTCALLVSMAFLASYLHYHYHYGSTRFTGEGMIRSIYFIILITHTILAAGIVPLALITVFWAFRSNFERHKKIARWTWPIWMYVSVTGVIIYLMLYQMPHGT